MSESGGDNKGKRKRTSIKLHGTVDKLVPPPHPSQAEKAQIVIKEAEDLYKEIRIDNSLEDGGGKKVKLKRGTEVDVIVEVQEDGIERPADGQQKKIS